MQDENITIKGWPKVVTLIAGLLVVVSMFLPWTQTGGSSANLFHEFFQMTGYTYIIGATAAIIVIFNLLAATTRKSGLMKAASILSVIAALIGGFIMYNCLYGGISTGSFGGYGAGAFLAVAAYVVALVFSLIPTKRKIA